MKNSLVIRIPEEQKLLLEAIANNNNVSVSEITRRAIQNYINFGKKGKENLFFALAKISKSKKIKNSPKDLSLKYKKYLYKG